jgi:hypothetical protein
LLEVAFRADVTVEGTKPNQSQYLKWAGPVGVANGAIVDCGDGTGACPAAKGNICLVQWGLRDMEEQSRPSSSRSVSARLLNWFSGVSGSSGRPGNGPASIPEPGFGIPIVANVTSRSVSSGSPVLCSAMRYCVQQGAKAMMVNAPISDLQISCDTANGGKDCSCIQELTKSGGIPMGFVGLEQYKLLQAAFKAGEVKGTVQTRVSNGTCLMTATAQHISSTYVFMLASRITATQ